MRQDGVGGEVESTRNHRDGLLTGDGRGGFGVAVLAHKDRVGVELEDGVLPVIPGGVAENGRGRLGTEAHHTVDDSGESSLCDGIVGVKRAVPVAGNQPVFGTPLVNGGFRGVALRVRKRADRRHGKQRNQQTREQKLKAM